MSSLPLDVTEVRAALQLQAELQTLQGTLEIERLVLDTGCNVPLIAPLSEVRGLLDSTWTPRKKALRAIGGQWIRATVGQATLVLGSEPFERVEVYAVDQQDGWLLGLPILMRCDILLREAHPAGPQLVLPEELGFPV